MKYGGLLAIAGASLLVRALFRDALTLDMALVSGALIAGDLFTIYSASKN